jgi:hypothetical protein
VLIHPLAPGMQRQQRPGHTTERLCMQFQQDISCL